MKKRRTRIKIEIFHLLKCPSNFEQRAHLLSFLQIRLLFGHSRFHHLTESKIQTKGSEREMWRKTRARLADFQVQKSTCSGMLILLILLRTAHFTSRGEFLRLTNILEREAKALPNRIQAGWTCQNSQRGRRGIEQHSRLALLRIRQVTFAWQGGRQGRSEIEKLAFWDENQLGKKEWKRGASRCQTKCEPQKGKSNNRAVSSSPSFSPTPLSFFLHSIT